MLQSSPINLTTLAVRSYDLQMLSWLRGLIDAPLPSELTPDSRLVIYGDDHHNFLSRDNNDESLSHCHAALCISKPVSASYLDLYRHNVRHVIYRKQPFASEALRLAVLSAGAKKSLVACNNFREFQPPPEIIDSFDCPLLTDNDSNKLRQCAEEFFAQHSFPAETVQSVNLCVKEAVTNAIFHGFREAGTHDRKYMPETFHGLYDSDFVAVSFTLTPDWLAVKVWDNSGSLGPLSVANSLDRHLTNRGIMDTRGRGFYLMQHLSDRLVVCIRRRQETSIQMFFTRQPAPADAPRHLELITY